MSVGKFVSRGGEKLRAALDTFNVRPFGWVVLDVGSSTGGFVDCLLQNGVKRVYSVDTSYGELAWVLRNDQRVVVMERTNILHLQQLPEQVDLITIDASWTKLEKILPVVEHFLKPDGLIIALLKPHYQSDKKHLVKGVLLEDKVVEIKDKTIQNIKNLGFFVKNEIPSPILGGGGNREFLLGLKQAKFN